MGASHNWQGVVIAEGGRGANKVTLGGTNFNGKGGRRCRMGPTKVTNVLPKNAMHRH
jgi:hypothetical protein